MRTMYDAVTPGNIPRDAQVVAGYINGRYAWRPQDWAMFPHSLKVTIAVNAGADAKCLDVETYDATPAEAPGWVRRQRSRGEPHPWVYMSESVWPEVRRQFAAQKVAEPIWWVAGYPGSVGHTLYPGSHAHQYYDDGGKDWSVVADHVPGLDPEPGPPPAPAPKPRPMLAPLEGDTMILYRNGGAVCAEDGSSLTGDELKAIEDAYRYAGAALVIVDSPTLYAKRLKPGA